MSDLTWRIPGTRIRFLYFYKLHSIPVFLFPSTVVLQPQARCSLPRVGAQRSPRTASPRTSGVGADHTGGLGSGDEGQCQPQRLGLGCRSGGHGRNVGHLRTSTRRQTEPRGLVVALAARELRGDSLPGFCFLGEVPFWGSGARPQAAILSETQEGISPSPGPAGCSTVLLLAQCPFPTVWVPRAGQGCAPSPRDSPCTCFLECE